MITKVLNIYGNRQESAYEVNDLSRATFLNKNEIPFALVEPTGFNRRAYVIDSENIIVDDLLSKDNLSFDFSSYYDLNLLLSGISYDVTIKNKIKEYSLKSGFSTERKEYRNKLRTYFESYYNFRCRKTASDQFIIPVPDNLEIQAQDRLLNATRVLNGNTLLLWRSVAACIGAEGEIARRNLKEGDKILVLDFHANGVIKTILTLHDHEGRLIPGHKIFYDCNTRTRKIENYPEDYLTSKTLSNTNYFPFEFKDENLVSKVANVTGENSTLRNNFDLILVVGKGMTHNFGALAKNIIYDSNESLIERGAALFSYRQKNNIVSYFDECDDLSLVIQTRDEEIILKTLIKGSDRVAGGIKIESPPIDDIYLQKGSTTIKFFLLMGPKNNNRQLKVLEQKIELTKELINNPKVIELQLFPSMIAGQGQAFVEVKAKDNDDKAYFSDVFLDWENMEDAYDGKNKITVSYLENTMQRSFPIDMPFVQAYDDLSYYVVREFDDFIQYGVKFEINRSSWPNSDKSDLTRFQRINLFGSPRANLKNPSRDLSLPGNGIAAKKFLENLKIKVNQSYPYIDEYIKYIAWSYHPEYFEQEIKQILQEVYVAGKNQGSIAQTKLTLCANLLYKDEDLQTFFYAFILRLRACLGINSWTRAMYQVLMYNNTFLQKISIDDFHEFGKKLVLAYESNDSEIIRGNIIKCLIFGLKIRRYYINFCRDDSPNLVDRVLYQRLYSISNHATLAFVNAYDFEYQSGLKKISKYKGPQYVQRIEALRNKIHDKKYRSSYHLSIEDLDFITELEPLAIRLRIISRDVWAGILRDYLKGKGNLDMPVGDLND